MNKSELSRWIRSFGISREARNCNLTLLDRDDLLKWVEAGEYKYYGECIPIIVAPKSSKQARDAQLLAHVLGKVIALHSGFTGVKTLRLPDLLLMADNADYYQDYLDLELLIVDDFVEDMPNPLTPREQLSIRALLRSLMRNGVCLVLHSHCPISKVKEWWSEVLVNELTHRGIVVEAKPCLKD